MTITGEARSWEVRGWFIGVDTALPVLLVCTMVTRFVSFVWDPLSLFRNIICRVDPVGSEKT